MRESSSEWAGKKVNHGREVRRAVRRVVPTLFLSKEPQEKRKAQTDVFYNLII